MARRTTATATTTAGRNILSIQTKTSISKHLQDLINTVNNSIQTVKEQILEIYDTAKKEGFTPQEARILIEEKVIKVTDRYIRLVLPSEAKDQSKVRNKNINTDDFENGDNDNNEDEYELEKPSDFAELLPQIPAPPEQKIVDADSEELLHDLPEPTEDDSVQDIPKGVDDEFPITETGKEVLRLRSVVEQLTEENTRLRIQKIGTVANKFDFEYDYEMPSGSIIPFIVTAFPDKKTGYIRLNKSKIEENEKKEAKKK
jgi:hypothetical protein